MFVSRLGKADMEILKLYKFYNFKIYNYNFTIVNS